jgi:hypothetical protein
MVGGEKPPDPRGKLTGYTIEGIDTAKYHLKKLKDNSTDITVLLDDTNVQSVAIWNLLLPSTAPPQTPPLSPVQIGGGHTMTPLAISTPSFTQTITDECFMVIPNAMYYQHSGEIAAMVAASNAVKLVYYPEREYAPTPPLNPRQTVKVYGHHIPKTFKDAADIVKGILNSSVAPPAVRPGQIDHDPGS